MKTFDFLVGQRRFVYLVIGLLSAAGVASALSLPSSIYPELRFEQITIVAEGTSLGSRPQLFSVTRPLEEAVSVVPGLERVRSRTIRGASELSLYFASNTDMTVALQLVEARVNEVRADLPPQVSVTTERMLPSLFPIVTYNVIGMDATRLYDLASYRIRPALAGIPGVGRIEVQGSEVREVHVIAEPARLSTAGVSYQDLAAAIQSALDVQAVGRVERNYKQYLVLRDAEAHSIEDVGAVVIRGSMRVRDVAVVEMGTEDRVRLVRGDGKPAVLISISRQPEGSTLAVADSIESTMRSMQSLLPADARIEKVYDQAALVREAVKSVAEAMLIGALLTIVILFLFLQHGAITAISAASIPLTLAITVFVMRLTGATFNLMSLGGMAVATGLVIDDTVVVTENIVRHLGLSANRRSSIREALAELVWPVTTSTLTTVVVFLPLRLLKGVVGQFFVALSTTLVIAVLVSLGLAMTLVPLLAEQFVHAESEESKADPGRPRNIVTRGVDRLGGGIKRTADRYAYSLNRVLRRPGMLLSVSLFLLLAGIVLYRFVGTGFLPVMDEGAFVLDYVTPTGTALSETDREIRLVESTLAETPEVVAFTRRTGAEMGLFATGQNSGDIVVRLAAPGDRSRDIFAIIDEVRGKVSEALPRMKIEFVLLLTDLVNDLAGTPHPVEIKLFGDQLGAMEEYALTISQDLEAIRGLVDLSSGVADPEPELSMQVDPIASARLGLTPQDVSAQAQAAMLGIPGGEVRSGEQVIEVRIRAPDGVRFDPLQVGTIPIFGIEKTEPTPLSTLATFTDRTSQAELLRENRQQMVVVTAGIENASLGAVFKEVRSVIAAKPPPAGVRLEIAGQYAGQREAFRSMLLVLTLACLCVVAVMLIQFESFIEPLVILFAAPLSFVGGFFLLLVTGTPLNVSSLMGLTLLVGLIVKNGIILLDFTRHRMRVEGENLEEAMKEAARVRLRPILMTTLCTLFSLLPLAFGVGSGAELQRPLALTVIGGLALSTPVTLYVVPTLLLAIRGPAWRLNEPRSSEPPMPVEQAHG